VTYAVDFSDPDHPRRLLPRRSASWKLAGAGELSIEPDQLILRGRRRRLLLSSAPHEVAIPADQVHNVAQTGRHVRCDVTTPYAADRELQLWAADEATAQEIARRLPQERTARFAQQQSDREEFERRLGAVGGRPVVTWALVGANCLAFAVTLAAGAGLLQPNPAVLVQWGSNFGPRTLGGEWWRLFTSMFLHFGLLHLLFNMWALWSLGQLTERLFGSAYYLAVYLFAGLCGSVASLLWHPSINSAGASGAIFGVLGGLLAFMVNPRTRIPASIVAAQRNSALVFVAYNLLNGFAHAGIDNAAHIGGLLSGFAFGWVLGRPLDAESRQNPAARLAAAAAAAIVAITALSWPLTHPSPVHAAELQFRRQFQLYAEEESRIIGAQTALQQLVSDSKITQHEWGRRLARDILPRWEAAEQGLAAVKLPESSPFAAVQNGIEAFLDDKRLGLALLSEAAIDDDPAKAARANEALGRSDRRARELGELIARTF
jgi:rhomboid protease GluP